MSEKLKPCPFCGGKARLEAIDFDDDYPTNLSEAIWWVMCTKCGAHTDEYSTPTEAEAIAAWNTRAERTCRNEREEKTSTIVENRGWYICSCCGECFNFKPEWFFCPWCGAKVVEE